MKSIVEFKPTGYNAISPYLIVEGAKKMVNMLQQVFDGTVKRRFDNEDGTINHVEVLIDDSIIMLSEASKTYPANQFLLHVYVPDVFGTFQKAIDFGCIAIEAPINKEGDPDIRGTFEDFAGNEWAIGMQKEAVL